MQNEEKRKRRCAIDSDSTEEYMQLAEITCSHINIYYDDKKIEQLQKLRILNQKNGHKLLKEQELFNIIEAFQQFEGFDHNFESPNIQYIDTCEVPELRLSHSQQDEMIAHNIMIIGDITEQVKNYIITFCKEDCRKSSDEFEVDLMSPLKSKVCLDIAVKRINGYKNQINIIKFLMYDMSLQNNYEQIIEIYIKQCQHFIFIFKVDQTPNIDFLQLNQKINHINERSPKIFLLGYTDNDFKISPREKATLFKDNQGVFCLFELQDFQHINKSLNKIIQVVIKQNQE